MPYKMHFGMSKWKDENIRSIGCLFSGEGNGSECHRVENPDQMAVMGCLARIRLGKRTAVGYYNETLSPVRTCMDGKRMIGYLAKGRSR